MTLSEFVNFVLAILTVLAQGIFLVLLFYLITGKGKKIATFFISQADRVIFIVALVATLGSLIYSEILGYTPCKLCWFQRIFMYPQAILLGMALYKKDKNLREYSLVLSYTGGLIALYHYLLQLGFVPELACSAVGLSVSCSQKFVMHFGYITIPMMALSAFALIVVNIYLAKSAERN